MASTTLPNILFKITPTILNLYDQSSVFLTKPYLLAIYDNNYGEISLANKIRYFKIPELSQYPLDLNSGYETFRPRQSDVFSNTMEITLKYIMSTAAEGGDGSDDNVDGVERTTIYTRRGTLATIMQSNFVKHCWSVRVSRYMGNLYMVVINNRPYRSSEQVIKRETHHERLDKLLFAESPYELPTNNEPLDENVIQNGVHRSYLGKYSIFYAGDIQGIIADEKFKDFNDVEALNKCRFVFGKQIWFSLKHDDVKFLNYWLHAYLANVRDIYVAYKNWKGVVEQPIDHKIVSNLPNNRCWTPNACTAFLKDFLEHVEKLMFNVDCLNTVYDFHFDPYKNVITYEIFEGKTEKTLLTQDYIDFCKDKNE